MRQHTSSVLGGESHPKEGFLIRITESIKTKAKKDLSDLRIAILRYFGDTGGICPSSLEELVPKYIDRIPEGDWEYKNGKVISKSHPDW